MNTHNNVKRVSVPLLLLATADKVISPQLFLVGSLDARGLLLFVPMRHDIYAPTVPSRNLQIHHQFHT